MSCRRETTHRGCMDVVRPTEEHERGCPPARRHGQPHAEAEQTHVVRGIDTVLAE